jgi:hypothetical protein
MLGDGLAVELYPENVSVSGVAGPWITGVSSSSILAGIAFLGSKRLGVELLVACGEGAVYVIEAQHDGEPAAP